MACPTMLTYMLSIMTAGSVHRKYASDHMKVDRAMMNVLAEMNMLRGCGVKERKALVSIKCVA